MGQKPPFDAPKPPPPPAPPSRRKSKPKYEIPEWIRRQIAAKAMDCRENGRADAEDAVLELLGRLVYIQDTGELVGKDMEAIER